MLGSSGPSQSRLRPVATDPLRVSIFGAAPDTGNLGVSALCVSLLEGLWDRNASIDAAVFDHGRKPRRWVPAGMPATATTTLCGSVHSRRIYRTESHWRMWAAASWGLGSNHAVERVRASDAVLDVSGGDSFSDLYGPKRFAAVTFPKRLAAELQRPLILLPQTYGPFHSKDCEAKARQLIRSATMAWARDARSFEVMKALLDENFDPRRHRCSVDMAFGLTARNPEDRLPEPIRGWISARTDPVIGINISGLIANNATASAARFGLQADYREMMSRLVCETLRDCDLRVVLVPHVLAPIGHRESDLEASLEIVKRVPRRDRSRVAVLPTGLTASETKWVISQLDWLCATRMHACIAGLSSGVPVAGVAYSDKARGVFESCGQGRELIDPRMLGTEEALEALLASCHHRAATARALTPVVEAVRVANSQFFDELNAAVCDESVPVMQRSAA